MSFRACTLDKEDNSDFTFGDMSNIMTTENKFFFSIFLVLVLFIITCSNSFRHSVYLYQYVMFGLQEEPDLIPSSEKLFIDNMDDDFVVLSEPDIFTVILDRISTQCTFTIGRLFKILPRLVLLY